MSAAGKVNIHEALQLEAQQTLGQPMLVTRFIVIRELQPPQGGAMFNRLTGTADGHPLLAWEADGLLLTALLHRTAPKEHTWPADPT